MHKVRALPRRHQRRQHERALQLRADDGDVAKPVDLVHVHDGDSFHPLPVLRPHHVDLLVCSLREEAAPRESGCEAGVGCGGGEGARERSVAAAAAVAAMVGWDGMGWDGMGWDGKGWDGMGTDGMGWEGRDYIGLDQMEA